MFADINNPALIHDHNTVGPADCRKTMGDDKGSSVAKAGTDSLFKKIFRQLYTTFFPRLIISIAASSETAVLPEPVGEETTKLAWLSIK